MDTTLETIAANRRETGYIENDGGGDYLALYPAFSEGESDPWLYAIRVSWNGRELHSWFDSDLEGDSNFTTEYQIHEPRSMAEVDGILDQLFEVSRNVHSALARV